MHFGIGEDQESEDKQLDSLRSTPSSINRNSSSVGAYFKTFIQRHYILD